MAFPTIPTAAAGRALASTGLTCASGQTFPNLSSLTKNSGDLLIAIVLIYDGNSTNAEFSSWGAGFTEFGDFATTTGVSIGCAYKISTGSETGTFTVTSSDTSTNDYATILLSIPDWHGTAAPEAGGYATGTNSNADPGSLTPSWGSADTLWIAVAGVGETSTAGAFQGVIGLPSGYSDELSSGISADVVGGMEGTVGFLQNAAASEDPGTFNTDTSNARWGAITIAVRPALAGISASLTQTDATDTTSVASTLAIAGSLSQSEAVDTTSSAATLAIAASLAQSEDADTISATGTIAGSGITADASITEAADTIVSYAVPTVAAATVALVPGAGFVEVQAGVSALVPGVGFTDDTALAAGGITADATITEAADTVSAAATLAIAGDSSQSEAADTISAAASLGIAADVGNFNPEDDAPTAAATLAIAASLAQSEDADTISGAATLAIAADLNASEAGDTVSAAATLAIAAAASVTEDGDTISAAGGSPALVADVAVTEDADTSSAAASVAIAASLDQSEGADTVSGAATLAIAASLAQSEEADAISASASGGQSADVDVTEDADAASSAASLAIAGSLAQSEAADSASSAAALAIAASSSVTEGADTISADLNSGVGRTATLDVTEAGDSISASATIPADDTVVSLPGPPLETIRRRRVRPRVADEWPITAKLHVVEQGDGCVAGATMGPTWQARQAVARLLLAA